ncbi:MAG: hypothetical protein ACI3XM_02240 [Eubacteriales bacterium]
MPRIYTSRTGTSAYRAHAKEVWERRSAQLVKWFFCAVCTLFLCLLEHTSFSYSGDGTAAIPFLLPVWAAAAGLFEGPAAGAWFGLFAGLISDAAGGARIYLLPFVFMCFGFLAGLVGTRILRRRFVVYLACDLAVCVLYAGYRLIGMIVTACVYHAELPDVTVLLSDAGRDAVCAALWSVPLYLPAKRIFGKKT